MSYFKKVKVGDKLYGIVFGAGKVTQVFEHSHYKMMVTFKNGYEVPYTEEGVPGWGNFTEQTIFYKKEIDLTEIDFLPVTKVLSMKKITKLQQKEKLEMRLPSGAWSNILNCPKDYIDSMLEKENYHLFRKKH